LTKFPLFKNYPANCLIFQAKVRRISNKDIKAKVLLIYGFFKISRENRPTHILPKKTVELLN